MRRDTKRFELAGPVSPTLFGHPPNNFRRDGGDATLRPAERALKFAQKTQAIGSVEQATCRHLLLIETGRSRAGLRAQRTVKTSDIRHPSGQPAHSEGGFQPPVFSSRRA